ncbi:MAG TPA: sulfotransferase [Pyrinomonadaceae bacterium]|nr:sulfotransferase [Pyrinomonadaceae bacterium]
MLKSIWTRRRLSTELPPAPFIVGVPRSGTTLLRLMCDAHPELSIPPEMGFMPVVAGLRGRGDELRQAFFNAVAGMVSWDDANIPRETFEKALREVEPFTVAEGVRTFYRLYAARFGKARWGDKTPAYCLHMDKIEKLLPEARFVHIIRDGRDVALSVRGLWFSPGDRIEDSAERWRSWILTARAQGKRRRHYMEVRYEELIADAPAVLRKVCDFIGLTYDERMERYYESSPARLDEVKTMYRDDGSLLITKEERLHNQRFVTQPPEPSRVFRWRVAMDAETQMRFAAVAGDLLAELGYPID